MLRLLEDRRLLDPSNLLLKRVFDLVVAGSLALFAAPVLASIALAIRFDSPGPAIFVQRRVGRGGRTFPCLKFRTMFHDAEALPAPRPVPDPRVTRAGRWLRATHLDELPQLLNVLAGQMSLVGPRPLPGEQYDRLGEPDRAEYREVPPGLTGLGQACERAGQGVEHTCVLTAWYARNWTIGLDAILVLRTIRGIATAGKTYENP